MEMLGNNEIPIGFSMALARDTNAMNAFSAMPKEQRKQVIETSRTIQTKREMEQFVNSFTSTNNKTF